MNRSLASWVGLVLFANSLNAAAIDEVDCRYEAPVTVFSSSMEMVEATFGFKNVTDVILSVTRDACSVEPTGIKLRITSDNPEITRLVNLKIVGSERDECGSMHYHAVLEDNRVDYIKNGGEIGNRYTGPRMNVHLVDHATRVCEDYRPHRLQASVREGFGWCGTGDSTMELVGNVFTRQ